MATPSNREFLATILRHRRENAGLSQQAVADRVGLSRTAVAQIELGNRPVSDDELVRFKSLYRRLADDLAGETERPDDILNVLIESAPALEERRAKNDLETILGLCREAVYLEATLGRLGRSNPPRYEVSPPRGVAQAVSQGERTANHERQRLGLGTELPAGNIVDLATSQDAHVVAMDLPEEVIGIFVRHVAVGTLIIASGKRRASRERFGVLRGYAHALFERDRAVVVTTPTNAEELVEVRADAFATAFLLPAAGIESALSSLDKGRSSRHVHAIYGLATDEPIRAEVRAEPGSQKLTGLDVLMIARRFGASYPATVYRLFALNVIGKPEIKDLHRAKHQRAAREFGALFARPAHRGRKDALADEGVAELKASVAALAIEADRRKLLDKGYLAELVSKLQIPELSESRLRDFVEAIR
jgi:transcriptional regulator with XRE-family HTH domain/Zn-dependent peptidase ImmA (M78 family)